MKLNNAFVVTATNFDTFINKTCSYEDSFSPVCIIYTVEEMLWFLKHIKNFDDYLVQANNQVIEEFNINIFKDGITPKWEDAKNINGCSYILNINHGKVISYIFEQLIFNFMTNKFITINVNGIRLDIKKTYIKIEIWASNIPTSYLGGEVFKELSTLLGFNYNVSFLCKNHQKLVDQLK
ncbi:translation initiation factor 4E [Enterocytozoon bieneusi H348]|nr:translation initiation factor 4E [Enterocytozoon bieneusi H348]|eukprot:XP_001827992.1 translation initiation factor 4E [Enterocytozoon bieneusi H348]